MKKLLFVSIMALIILAPSLAAQNFSLSLTGNVLSPADEDYKALYGNSSILPELKVNYYFNNLFVWAGFGILSGTGTTFILEEETKSTQTILSLGAGYGGHTNKKVEFAIQGGIVIISYTEEAFGIKMTGSAIGFRGDAQVLFNVNDSLFLEGTVGYIYGTDSVEGLAEDIKLGGLKAGAGVGIRF